MLAAPASTCRSRPGRPSKDKGVHRDTTCHPRRRHRARARPLDRRLQQQQRVERRLGGHRSGRHHAHLLGEQPGHQPGQRQGGARPRSWRSSPQQTGIKVNLEVIGWNDLQTRIQTAITSGSGPDVLNIGNTWAASLQATGAFLPFDDAAMTAIGGKDKFVTASLATGGTPGQDPTSVPLYGLAYGLYYNKAMFAAAGLQPPTTWEEMVSRRAEAHRPGQEAVRLGARGRQLHRERPLRVHQRPAERAPTGSTTTASRPSPATATSRASCATST